MYVLIASAKLLAVLPKPGGLITSSCLLGARPPLDSRFVSFRSDYLIDCPVRWNQFARLTPRDAAIKVKCSGVALKRCQGVFPVTLHYIGTLFQALFHHRDSSLTPGSRLQVLSDCVLTPASPCRIPSLLSVDRLRVTSPQKGWTFTSISKSVQGQAR